jgi:hypothetical protein
MDTDSTGLDLEDEMQGWQDCDLITEDEELMAEAIIKARVPRKRFLANSW